MINRIPDELMRRLREAKLARGIHGVPSKRTVAGATWFVFLNAEIRDRVLSERRVQAAARKKRSGSGEQDGLHSFAPRNSRRQRDTKPAGAEGVSAATNAE